MGRNYANEIFLPVDDQLWQALEGITARLRSQLETPDKHYPVQELLGLSTDDFLNKWDKGEFPSYKKVTPAKTVDEYQGIYLFSLKVHDGWAHQYTGISRGIWQRFKWHASRTIINHATWAWLMIRNPLNETEKQALKADKPNIKQALKAKQAEAIYPCVFTFVPICDNMLMHLAEVYCANQLHCHWNSFRTH